MRVFFKSDHEVVLFFLPEVFSQTPEVHRTASEGLPFVTTQEDPHVYFAACIKGFYGVFVIAAHAITRFSTRIIQILDKNNPLLGNDLWFNATILTGFKEMCL